MNILVFSWRDPKHPLAGGAEQVMHEHMKGWIEAGNSVTLFSSKIKGLDEEDEIDGVKIIRRGYQYIGVQIAGIFYYLRNKHKYDVLVDQFHGIPFFTPLYSDKPKLAVIQEVARKVWLRNPLPFPLNWIIGIIGYLAEPLIFLFYQNVHFMTGSESARADLIKYGIPEKNITVVPHGVLTPGFKTRSLKPNVKTITYLGILSNDKGIEDAIKVFKILSRRNSFEFWVIGRGETKSYEDRIKKLAIGSKIKFWGHVSQKVKFELLAKSDVLINPSVHEGWGLVNIEANSVGTPVAAYKSPGLVDSVKDGVSGIIVKKNTPKELADMVQKMCESDDLYKKLQRGALIWSKRFDWKISKKLSLKLLYNLTK